MLVRESRTSSAKGASARLRGNEAVTAAVVLVVVTTATPSGLAMRAAAPGRACARRLRGAAAEAPGPSQGRLSALSASGRCHVSTRLDRRPFARRFAAPGVSGDGEAAQLGLTFDSYLVICIGAVTSVTRKWIPRRSRAAGSGGACEAKER
jgi:hypothetical protein